MANIHREVRLSMISASVAAVALTTGLALIGCENYGERTSERAPDSSRSAPGGGQVAAADGGEPAYERPTWSSRSTPGGRAAGAARPEPAVASDDEPAPAPARREQVARGSRSAPGGGQVTTAKSGESAYERPTWSSRSNPGGRDAVATRPEPAEEPAVEPAPAPRQRITAASRAYPGGGGAVPAGSEPVVVDDRPDDPQMSRRSFPGVAARESRPAPEPVAERAPEPVTAPTPRAERAAAEPARPAEPAPAQRSYRTPPPARASTPRPSESYTSTEEVTTTTADVYEGPSHDSQTTWGASRAFPGGGPVETTGPMPATAEMEIGGDPAAPNRAFPGGRGYVYEEDEVVEVAEVEEVDEVEVIAYDDEDEEGDIEPASGRHPMRMGPTRSFPGGEDIVFVDQGMSGLAGWPDYYDPNHTAMIELYGSKNGSGGLVGFTDSDKAQVIVFADDDRFADNEARSVSLRNVSGGTVIRLYDSPLGSRHEDWVEIHVKKPIISYTVDRLDHQYYDEYVTVIWNRDKVIMGEVSRMEIEEFHELELPYRPTYSALYPPPESMRPIVRR